MKNLDINRLQSLLKSQTNYVIRTDLSGNYTYWNAKYEQDFAWVYDGDLTGKHAIETILPKDHEKTGMTVMSCIQHPGKIFKVQLEKASKEGENKTSLWEFVCLLDDQGNPHEIQCVGTDISELKAKESELEQTAKEFRNLFDTMIQGVVYQNADGYITNANPAAQHILGLTLDQMQGRTSIDPRWRAVREDGSDFPGHEHPAMVALKTGRTIENVIMGIMHPGKNDYAWILVSAVPQFRNNEPQPFQVFASFTDITAQRKSRQEIEASENKFRILVENLPGVTYICKLDDTFSTVYMSKESSSVFGHEPNDFLTDPTLFAKIIPEPDFSELMHVVEQSVRDKSKYKHVYRVITGDGTVRWIEDYGEASYFEDGMVQYLIGYAIDITDNLNLVRDLQKQNTIQELMTSLSTSFINMPIEEIDERINLAMASIGKFVDGDRVYIIEYDFNKMVANNSYEWCADGIEPQIEILQDIPVDAMPEWLEAHLNGKTVVIKDVLALAEDDYTRSILEPQGIKSMIAIPMMDGETCLAFVGIDSVRNHHSYTKYEEMLLRIFADMIVNVRRRRQTQDALTNSERRNRNILEVSPVGIGVIQDNKLVYVNPKGCLMLGSESQDDLINKEISHFTEPDFFKSIQQVFSDLKEKKKVAVPVETKLKRLDGGTIPIEFSIQLMTYNEEHAYQIVAIDISVRKQVEEQLKLLSQSIEQSPVYIVITDKKGNIQYVNPSFVENVGFDYDEMIGQNPRIWKSGVHDNSFYETMWNVVLSGEKWQGEICNKKKSGELYWEKTIISPVMDELNNITNFVSVKEDVTEKKQAEKDRIAKQEAEAKSKAKSLFLSNMSHEIRTPLNAVIGFSQLLENDSSLTPKQSEYIFNISRSSQHLLTLIEDILDYTKLEANRMSINRRTFLLSRLAEDMKLMFEYRTREKEVTLELHLSDNLPRYIHSDEAKIRQILINVIGNAVKFTDSGYVSIVFNARFEQDNNQSNPSAILEVTVSDTGPGIAEEDLNFIFEEFRQFEAGHQKGGTGLGMPICKRLTDLLGGSLEISSQLDLGTVVKIEIPVEVAEDFIEDDKGRESTSVLTLGGTSLKILIVDDQLENQLLLWYMLKDAGFDIKKASSGKEALDIIEKWTPDCALIDIRMPDINGLELTKALRNNPKTASIKIIAISASSYNFGSNMYEETGLDDFIVKPVIQDGLLKILEKNLSIKFPDKKNKISQLKMPTTHSKLEKYFSEVSDSDKTNLIHLIRSGDVDMFQEYTTNSSTLSSETKIELLKLLDQYDFDKIIHLLELNHDG